MASPALAKLEFALLELIGPRMIEGPVLSKVTVPFAPVVTVVTLVAKSVTLIEYPIGPLPLPVEGSV